MSINAIGLFCQDIRAERENSISIIGVMPDNANLTEFIPNGTMLPRFALYVRINFSLDETINSAAMWLLLPGDRGKVDLGPVDQKIIEESYAGAKRINSPFGSIYLRVDMSPFPIPALGWLKVMIRINDTEILAGAIRFTTGETTQPGLEITRQATASISPSQPS